MRKQKQYRFYPTILDQFQRYLDYSKLYHEKYRLNEEPPISEEDFEKQVFQNLIDRINRVPFESEAAEKGSAFNEVIDCIIEGRSSKKYNIKSNKELGLINVHYHNYEFHFPIELCKHIASKLNDGLPQQRVSCEIQTKYGLVELYGHVDFILPFKTVDLKTTNRYKAFKYRKGWQHRIYPLCLHQNNIPIDEFEYLVTDFREVYSEQYTYDNKKHFFEVKEHCESFIEFLNINNNLITDQKIMSNER